MSQIPFSITYLRKCVMDLHQMATNLLSFNASKSFEDAKYLYIDSPIFGEKDDMEWRDFRKSLDVSEITQHKNTNMNNNLNNEIVQMTIDLLRYADLFNILKQRTKNPLFNILATRGTVDQRTDRDASPSTLIDWAVRNALCRSLPLDTKQLLAFSAAIAKLAHGPYTVLARTMFLAQIHKFFSALKSNSKILTLNDCLIFLQYCRLFDVYHGRLFGTMAQIALASLRAERTESKKYDIQSVVLNLLCTFWALGYRARKLESAISLTADSWFAVEEHVQNKECKTTIVTEHTDSLFASHIIPQPLSKFTILLLEDKRRNIKKLQKRIYESCLEACFLELEKNLEKSAENAHFINQVKMHEIKDLITTDASFFDTNAEKMFYSVDKLHSSTIPIRSQEAYKVISRIYPFPSRFFLQQLRWYIQYLIQQRNTRKIQQKLSDVSKLFTRSHEMLPESSKIQAMEVIGPMEQNLRCAKKYETIYFIQSARQEWQRGERMITKILQTLYSKFRLSEKKFVNFSMNSCQSTVHTFLMWICRFSFPCLKRFSGGNLAMQLFFVLKLAYFPVPWTQRVILLLLNSEKSEVTLLESPTPTAKATNTLRIRYLILMSLLSYIPNHRKEKLMNSSKIESFRTMGHLAWRTEVQEMIDEITKTYRKN